MPTVKLLRARKQIRKKIAGLHKQLEGDARTLEDIGFIIDGTEALQGQLLEVVGISHLGMTCTGTLIHPKAVLTAAHCVCTEGGGTEFENARVVIGNKVEAFSERDDYKSIGGWPYYKDFCRVFHNANGGFPRELEGNDLALLILDRPVPASRVKPIALVMPIGHYMRAPRPRKMRIAGFGWTEKGTLGVKMHTKIDVADPMCSRPEKYGCLRGAELVLKDRSGNKDTCQGDSGGPAFYLRAKKRYLAGVTSRAAAGGGGGCGDGGIYTLLTPGIISWINSHTPTN